MVTADPLRDRQPGTARARARLAYPAAAAAVLGAALRDVLLTPEEYQAHGEPGWPTSDSASQQAQSQPNGLDLRATVTNSAGWYANELDRHYRSPVSLFRLSALIR